MKIVNPKTQGVKNEEKEYLALVISDLHLGEEDSILMESSLEINRTYLGKVKEYLKKELGDSKVRYLILLGDAMDLSLARRKQAFQAFRTFLEVFNDLMDRGLIYLPGNHDHHMWVAIQEEAQVFQKIRNGQTPEPYYHALCPRLDKNGLHLPKGIKIGQPYGQKTFLYKLLPKEAQEKGKDFLVAYPNIYIRLGDRSLLLTHGHFFEAAWTLFTDVFPRALREVGLEGLSFKKLEQINSPFIEFGWYSLGQAGELGKLLEKIWDEIHNGRVGPVTNTVLDDLFDYLDEVISFEKENFFSSIKASALEAGSDVVLRGLKEALSTFLSRTFSKKKGRPGSFMRHHKKVLSEEKTKVQRYLELALPSCPDLNTLVFGHTHIPFHNGNLPLDTPGGERRILCFNTGGWITDIYDPGHLALSKPMALLLCDPKEIKPIYIPWPEYDEFEEALDGKTDPEEKRSTVKDLLTKTLNRTDLPH